MPKNTKVFRCVRKLSKKRDLGASIAICQAATKQNYMTGKKLKRKKTRKLKKRNRKTKKGGTYKLRFLKERIAAFENYIKNKRGNNERINTMLAQLKGKLQKETAGNPAAQKNESRLMGLHNNIGLSPPLRSESPTGSASTKSVPGYNSNISNISNVTYNNNNKKIKA